MPLLDHVTRERIEREALGLLATQGVRLEHPEVREALLQAGARAGAGAEDLLIPEAMVRDAVQAAPSEAVLADRRGRTWRLCPNGDTMYITGNALMLVEGLERRAITTTDLANLARVVEASDNADGVVGTSVADVTPTCRDFVGFRVLAENSTKHLRPVIFSPRGAETIIEMARVLGWRPGQNIFSLGYSCVSPSTWPFAALELLRATSGYRIPIMLNSEPMAGGTSPVTLAGSILVATAEGLSGVVIAQTLEPGRPVIFNLGFAHVLDMRTAVALTGSAETCLLACAGAEMAAHFGLPSASWVSTESLVEDAQAGYEKMLGFLAHTQAGVNLIWGIGQVESQLSLSLEQAVIDDEIIGYVRRFVRGIEVSESQLAVDVIRELGHRADYLTHSHTLEHFRRELTDARLGNRDRRVNWEARGSRSLREAAHERVREILDSAQPCVSEDQRRELRRIEQAALRA